MSPYNQLLSNLVQAQERIIGPVAWDVVRRVSGLAVDSNKKEVAIVNQQKAVFLLLQLISRYEKLYGEVARAVCRQVITVVFAPEPIATLLTNQCFSDEQLLVVQKLDDLSQFELFDAIILDVTKTAVSDQAESVFNIVGQSNLMKRSLLCLYEIEQPPYQFLQFLGKSYLPKRVIVKAYTSKNQIDLIKQFLQSVVLLSESPQIKFTLRLTPKLNAYLEWLIKKKKINKAEYMRKVLQDQMDNDNEFLEN